MSDESKLKILKGLLRQAEDSAYIADAASFIPRPGCPGTSDIDEEISAKVGRMYQPRLDRLRRLIAHEEDMLRAMRRIEGMRKP